MNSQNIRDKHSQYLFPAVKNFYQESIVIDSGKGSQITDMDGNTYLDFFGGILTVSVGHANEEVNAAIFAQVNRLSHISSLYPVESVVELSERLVNITPGKLKKCFFTASGTEADETAVMLAQLFTGNTEIIALRHGYSGRSMLAQSLTAHSTWRSLPSQAAAVKHALSPYCYRCPLKTTYPVCGVACAEDVDELIRTTTTGEIAGMIVEPIQGVGGFITPPKEYFTIVSEIVRKYGGIFISDEVQTGFGRTGKMWGIEHYEVEPDIMTMAKGIANGLPLAAVVATGDIADSIVKNTISTFGGNPVSCAASNKTIEIILRDNLAENAKNMGDILRKGLEEIQLKNPKITGDIRGMGLMQAIEFVMDEPAGDRTPNTRAADQLMEETKRRGLLIGRGGLSGNVMRISPTLNISQIDVENALEILSDSFAAITD
ncbi:MAG: aspartate aminotransferase family protein [Candidatus Marinimicrobia bacterium]|nr:aspartate aminotransferase family protein [Candidatus Neomarinimicrobiota bacterium]MBL7010232.1 aspartate aminotransferase family protein [Candidatus Neomarinimicrobiota bacterium]MBL7030647.1 aspartate aminotransferase family protein [Candidatus Neomarinimicrobiota bacterium]